MANEIKKYLDHAGLTTYDEKIKKVITDGDTSTLQSAKDYADGLADNYDAAGSATTAESNAKAYAKEYTDALANGAVKNNTDAIAGIKEDVGTLDNLGTTAKTDIVSAINEVRNSVSVGGTAAAVTIDTNTTTDGFLKSYTIKQGENTVGTIDIPKDMVVESGEVVTNPNGQSAGTYIKLVLANVAEPLYINVGTLVDIYKAKAKATQVQIAIDSSTREISATIVAGSITSTELGANAVTTEKIADANVTKAKLSTEVQTSLGKADAAAPKTDLDAEIERATAAEAKALQDAKNYADSKVAGVDLTGIATNAADIDKLEASLAEGGATANAIAEAKKAGVDASAAVTALETGAVATNAAAISALEAKVGEGFTPITTAEIEALFA